MAISTSDAIFLGNLADADSNEFSQALENSSTYLGSFGSNGSPLHASSTSVTYDDANNDGAIETNNIGGEQISYDLGAGTVTTLVDSIAVVDITVTYTNGSTQAFNDAVMFQDTNGNLFLTNSNFAGTDLNGANNLPIESVNVTAVTSSGFIGLFQNALQSFVCFAGGTLIRTPDGDRPIEALQVGDLVATQDSGAQPIRWIAGRVVMARGRLQPIRIQRGALGPDLPARDLLVSRQHRMLVSSRIAHRMFATEEVLIPAKNLVGLPGIAPVTNLAWISYHHLLLDEHEVIYADNAPTESLLPGPSALELMGSDARAEILAIFPNFNCAMSDTARHVPNGVQQRQLVARHLKNCKPLVETRAAQQGKSTKTIQCSPRAWAAI